jgi:hypothetical protein
MKKVEHFWAVLDKKKKKIATWRTRGPDEDRGVEIHETKKLAQGAAFKRHETVVKVQISYTVPGESRKSRI